MGRLIDLRHEPFGRLKVVDRARAPDNVVTHHSIKKVYWLCECHEGNRLVVRADNLRSGAVNSCGCLRQEQLARARASRWKPSVDGHAAFNQGVAWSLKQLLAADHQDAADTLSREADAMLAARATPDAALFRTITRVADDGRAVVVRG